MTDAQQKVLESIKQLPDQCLQAWEETQKLEFGSQYKEIWNVAVCGMGASGLPTHVITSAFKTNVPVVSVNDYNVPSWANKHTLVYLSSYSGSTEEVLSCAEQAKNNECMVTGATSGGLPAGRQGKLGEYFKENNYTAYLYDPKHNPSEQPRMGLGYGIFGQLGILSKLGVVEDNDNIAEQVKTAVAELREFAQKIQQSDQEPIDKPTNHNHVLVILAAQHLVGSAHIFANQINETAKTFSTWFSIPEANHHLLEGLKRPDFPLVAIFLESENYSPNIKRRVALTKQIVEKNGHKIESYYASMGPHVKEILEILIHSSYATLRMAEIYNEDPIAIPWVDYFKTELGKI